MRSYSSVLLATALLLSACGPTRYGPSTYHEQEVGSEAKAADYVKRGKPYKIDGKWYFPLAGGERYSKTGVASWYGKDFHGKKTANGETYNMYAMTAAHTTLPLPSDVLVTNLDNGRQVRVRVNDRGPFVKNRLIDLSYSAAKALGYLESGTAHVRVETLGIAAADAQVQAIPADNGVKSMKLPYVQIGAFSAKASADSVVENLKPYLRAGNPPLRVLQAMNMYRVRMGPFDLDHDAEQALLQIKNSGYGSAMIIHD